MKVTLISKSDTTGGAAVVSMRLLEAMRNKGIDARMIVAEKLSGSPYVDHAAGRFSLKRAFLQERLGIFLANGLSRATLFKIDTASAGVGVWHHPWVKDADVVCLGWVNQGLLSLDGLRHIAMLGKPIVWTMHDMWNFTGICHHAYDCCRYEKECGHCPLLGRCGGGADLSHVTWRRKQMAYADSGIHFVAVSHWLARRASQSGLLGESEVSVIPNAVPIADMPVVEREESADGEIVLVMGAARLDDPVKGLPVLVEATRYLSAHRPELSRRLRLVTFGNLRNPAALDRVAISHTHLGPVAPDKIREVYAGSHIVMSTSAWETLPGTLIEGQAYGCVPVSLDRGGQTDIIDHRVTGWLAHATGDDKIDARAIAEGIEWAAHNIGEDIRRVMRRSVEQRFDARVVASRYVDLFNRLLCGR